LIATDYEACIDEFFVRQSVHVGESGRDDVRIVVGPCGDATVRIVDAELGASVDLGSGIRWRPESSSIPFDGRFLERDDEHELYRGRVPVGRGEPFSGTFSRTGSSKTRRPSTFTPARTISPSRSTTSAAST